MHAVDQLTDIVLRRRRERSQRFLVKLRTLQTRLMASAVSASAVSHTCILLELLGSIATVFDGTVATSSASSGQSCKLPGPLPSIDRISDGARIEVDDAAYTDD